MCFTPEPQRRLAERTRSKQPCYDLIMPHDAAPSVEPPLAERSLPAAATELARADPDLAALFAANGPPPLWGRRRGFATLVQIILEQQVSLSSAQSVFRRLKEAIKPLSSEAVVAAGAARLRKLGLTRQKAGYCLNLADAILSAEIDLPRLGRMADSAAAQELVKITGIGPWTAAIYLIMALRRPDVWPSGDIALVSSIQRVKALTQRPSTEEVLELADAWRPYRAVAARMLWHSYLIERGQMERAP